MDTTYARLSDGTLIKAGRGIEKKVSFYCAGCGGELYAATEGKKQYPHFRHKSSSNHVRCSNPESYVHWVTKELFAEHYRQAKEFYLSMEIKMKCTQSGECVQRKEHTINLKEIYPYITVEKSHQGFIPDCLLYNNHGDKLFFEVHYTSAISAAKKKSDIPILEVRVKEENDIDEILKSGGFASMRLPGYGQKYHPVFAYNLDTLPSNKSQFLTFDCKQACIERKGILIQEDMPIRIEFENDTLSMDLIENSFATMQKIDQRLYIMLESTGKTYEALPMIYINHEEQVKYKNNFIHPKRVQLTDVTILENGLECNISLAGQAATSIKTGVNTPIDHSGQEWNNCADEEYWNALLLSNQ